jgi:FkbM family methyltransferase
MDQDDIRLIFEKALLRISGWFGFQLKPKLRATAPPIDILGLALRDLMAREKSIFFVQIGAHDGRTGDPISPYIRNFGWKGMLIEPQPLVFAKLREHYADRPDLIFENVAVGESEGTLRLHCFQNATAEDHASMLASSRKHYLKLNSDNARGRMQEIEVPMHTLDFLLAKHAISRVDLLQIDTEGYDFQILKSVDFSTVRPAIIHFENNFLNRRQRDECADLLGRHGYAVMDLGIDTLAYLQPEDADFTERMKTSRVNG